METPKFPSIVSIGERDVQERLAPFPIDYYVVLAPGHERAAAIWAQWFDSDYESAIQALD